MVTCTQSDGLVENNTVRYYFFCNMRPGRNSSYIHNILIIIYYSDAYKLGPDAFWCICSGIGIQNFTCIYWVAYTCFNYASDTTQLNTNIENKTKNKQRNYWPALFLHTRGDLMVHTVVQFLFLFWNCVTLFFFRCRNYCYIGPNV